MINNFKIESLLEDYSRFLEKKGYLDSDWYCEEPRTVGAYMKENEIIVTDKKNIGLLRQWLNEERITDPKNLLTNEDIIAFLK